MDLHSGAAIQFKLGVLGSLLCQMMLEMMALRTTGEYVSEMLTMALVQRKCWVYFSLFLTNFLLRAQWKAKEPPWKLPRGMHPCSKLHASERACIFLQLLNPNKSPLWSKVGWATASVADVCLTFLLQRGSLNPEPWWLHTWVPSLPVSVPSASISLWGSSLI